MHTKSVAFSLDRQGVTGKGLLACIQAYFSEHGLEPLRFAIVKATREKVSVEAIVLERGK
ncbi:MAG TPA: hypothetical protein HA252_05465 [Candidatus Diapherotrites archaeon]|uniref:Uncharacterized protein n=1 Tax=Candidatus Iainarchaeum sp. TaxID=3101447 RepID=A0A7J4JLR0_9ARCH|nr:hypothetical protein [Candidatus Diapherotrites archaeon]HIH16827.1 hypothetical protein [Candidatus Diapherotrites archaeon]